MKMNKHKKYLTALVCLVCLFLNYCSVIAQTAIGNFSGNWILNEDKCDFGQLTAASASKVRVLKIIQSAADITVRTGDSTANSSLLLPLNGQPAFQKTVVLINGIPNTSRKEITLRIVSNRSFISTLKDPLNMPSSSMKTYTLSDNAQVLSISYKNTYGQQILAGRLVYDKKKD